MRPWQKVFTVGKWSYQLTYDHPIKGKCGDWVDGWTVLKNRDDGVFTDGPVTKRFYSSKKDAERGAAQIYNSIEKKLLL